MELIFRVIYAVGVIAVVVFSFYLIAGLVLDARAIDKSAVSNILPEHETELINEGLSDGYETMTYGVLRRGLVSDHYIDCFAETITVSIHGGYHFYYARLFQGKFYDNILKKYSLKELCVRGGFAPSSL
jgi:hypothetical protein